MKIDISDVKPVGHRVLIDPNIIPEETNWGFKLDVGKEYKQEIAATDIGTVIAIGPNAWKHPDLGGTNWVEVGDGVMFAKYGGKFIKVNEKLYVLVNDEDILAKVNVNG